MANLENTTPLSEEWLPVEGATGFLVSSLGRVLQIEDAGHGWMGRFVQGVTTAAGYIQASVPRKGRPSTILLHRLVCQTFHGEPPEGKPCVAHYDGNKTNNSASNLRWVSFQENAEDAKRLRSHFGMRRLMPIEALLMRRAIAGGWPNRDIMAVFDAPYRSVSRVRRGAYSRLERNADKFLAEYCNEQFKTGLDFIRAFRLPTRLPEGRPRLP